MQRPLLKKCDCTDRLHLSTIYGLNEIKLGYQLFLIEYPSVIQCASCYCVAAFSGKCASGLIRSHFVCIPKQELETICGGIVEVIELVDL